MLARKNPHSRSITDISSILENSFKGLKLDVILREQRALKVWDDVVGEKISGKAQPEKIFGSTLYVKVTSSPWMQELNFLKKNIIKKLNERLGEKRIDEIIFKLGRWEKPNRAGKSKKPLWLKTDLDKKDTDAIHKTVASLKDPELRNTISHLLTLEKKLKNFKEKTGNN